MKLKYYWYAALLAAFLIGCSAETPKGSVSGTDSTKTDTTHVVKVDTLSTK